MKEQETPMIVKSFTFFAVLVAVFAAAPISMWAQAPAPERTPATVRAATDQATFDSPEAAVQALIDAASKDDTAKLTSLFGGNGKQLLTSGDAQKDKAERQDPHCRNRGLAFPGADRQEQW